MTVCPSGAGNRLKVGDCVFGLNANMNVPYTLSWKTWSCVGPV
jgi:hypothetical protein